MKPQERIFQIEKELAELKKEPEQQSEQKKNVITQWPSFLNEPNA